MGEKRPEVYLPQIGVQNMIQCMPMMKHANGMQNLERNRRLMLFTEDVAIILI